MASRATASVAALARALGAPAPFGAAKAQAVGGFEEAQIEAFAEAAVEIQAINAGFGSRMQAAETSAEQPAIAEEANAGAVEAVKGNPEIDVEGYNAIARATREDPELAERVNAEIALLMQ